MAVLFNPGDRVRRIKGGAHCGMKEQDEGIVVKHDDSSSLYLEGHPTTTSFEGAYYTLVEKKKEEIINTYQIF